MAYHAGEKQQKSDIKIDDIDDDDIQRQRRQLMSAAGVKRRRQWRGESEMMAKTMAAA